MFNVYILQASCDLASFLIQLLTDQQIVECEKCVTIMMHALETSRHKGVIEAAGAALGKFEEYTNLLNASHLNSLNNSARTPTTVF
jgi:hypothetical protein